MNNTKAWELRQDGEAFPVDFHIYTSGDEDLFDEANAASFLIKTNSKDTELAKTVIDAWIAMMIEDSIGWDESIEDAFRREFQNSDFYSEYALTEDEYLKIHEELNNYNDVDTLYEYVDAMQPRIETLQEEIKQSLNQQFCRVRFGGRVNSEDGNSTLWFRVSSVGYNWYNTIYTFANSIYRGLHANRVSICRDAESDGQDETVFYTAKDGTLYFEMPIDEFFKEEHGSNPVFASADIGNGIYSFIKSELAHGETFYHIMKAVDVSSSLSRKKLYRDLFNAELKNCVSTHIYADNIPSEFAGKLAKAVSIILKQNPELDMVEVTKCRDTDIYKEFGYDKRPGFEVTYEVYHSTEDMGKFRNLPKTLCVDYNKNLSDISPEDIASGFRKTYLETLSFNQFYPGNPIC